MDLFNTTLLNSTTHFSSTSSSSSSSVNSKHQSINNTLTFVIGFGILILFVILGILASAFLCFTLKRDPYLWQIERDRQLEDKIEMNLDENCKERDKLTTRPTNDEQICQEMMITTTEI